MSYLCREKYRLELHWDKISYSNENIVLLEGAYFSGPVLRDAVKLEAPDFIDLDLTPQLIVVGGSYYIIRLSWSGVSYSEDGTLIYLKEAFFKNDYLKSIHKIQDNDFVLINTEKHEESTHAYYLVYDSQLIRHTKEPYNYRVQ